MNIRHGLERHRQEDRGPRGSPSATALSFAPDMKTSVAEPTAVTFSSICCALAVLALGFAVEIAHGFFHVKALAAILMAVVLCILAITGPRIAVFLPFGRKTAVRRIFCLVLVTYFFAGLATLRGRHDPIDVIVFENDGVHALLHGEDPYGSNVTHQDLYGSTRTVYGPGISANGRVHVGFPYPPLTLFWILPAYEAGDVRYSFLIAVLLAAILTFYLAPNLNGLLAAFFLLFLPETLFVLSAGWTEPLMLVALSATIVSARKAPRLLPLALGLFLASKQYSLLAVPLSALLIPIFTWKKYLILIGQAAAVAAIITLPFVLWDSHGFWQSLVTFQVVAPFRSDSLSLSALLFKHSLPSIPQWFVLVAVVAAIAFALMRAPRTPSGFAVSIALASLIFFIINKQAFCSASKQRCRVKSARVECALNY